MIFKNQVTEFQGARHRLIDADPQSRKGWLIALDEPGAMPISVPLELLAALMPLQPSAPVSIFRLPTPAEVKRRDKSLALLKPLLAHGRSLFQEQERFAHIKAYCKTGACSVPTAYKLLRAWWQNGQCADALLPMYRRSGRRDPRVTSGRGARKADGLATLQLTIEDHQKMEQVLRMTYLKDNRMTLTQAYQRLLEQYYSYTDANGVAYVMDSAERPSLKQLQHYLKKTFSNEHRLRMRKGDKEFELKHRGILGSVEEDCNGVGHIYECDATVGDVMLCAGDDKLSYIGKPTIYIIIDRRSRLIVGLYVGLENASWVCAREAVLFICEDKEAICTRYGIEYDEADWPAHGVFPEAILADLGEWNSRGGAQLATNLSTRVAYVPSRRGDWKPCVETTFKQTRVAMQDGVPGMDPPDNANKRQKKDYISKASLTLHEFTRLMLELVIKHNRTTVKSYELSSADLRNEFKPTPIAIWNKEIAERSGVLTRYDLSHVQFQLLPRDTASVTEHGVLFKGCYYTSQHLLSRGWFSDARTGRFKVEVAYDHRLVDNIYVLGADGSEEPCICSLTSKSQMHAGKSVAEVSRYIERLKLAQSKANDHDHQVTSEFHSRTGPVISASQKRLEEAPKRSRQARRADTKETRAAALKQEREVSGRLDKGTSPAELPTAATVMDFQLEKGKRLEAGSPPAATSPLHQLVKATGNSLEARARKARERLNAGLYE